VEAAVRGGVSVVQLREKTLATRGFYDEGLKIRDLLRSAGIPLIINDRIDLALALDADGVHVGQEDMPADVARRLLGPDRIVGISANTPSDLVGEAADYADYLAVSPVFYTATKEDITKPWELEGLRKARGITNLPLVAIGGVNAGNAREVAANGADCVAVVSDIVAADYPEEATRALAEAVRAGKAARGA
jgi:thiamine-phosphate pyrophosphorylase